MKLKIGQSIVIGQDWLEKKVKNPKTGHMVKVKSLPPKERAKYAPKKKKPQSGKSGRVLWYDQRDGHGVIEDDHGNEHYFDKSVHDENWKPDHNHRVSFDEHDYGTFRGTKNVKNVPHNHKDRTLVDNKKVRDMKSYEHGDAGRMHLEKAKEAKKQGDKESEDFHNKAADMHHNFGQAKRYDHDSKQVGWHIRRDKAERRKEASEARKKAQQLHKELYK